jgi:hypothetical protein
MYPRWRTALIKDGASPDFQVKWYADAVVAGVDVTAVPDLDKPGEPPESLEQILRRHWFLIVSGVSLLFVGVGLLFGVTPTRNENQLTNVRG